MPVSFNSPPRNFFLLGSGGEDAVTNFFHNINRTNPQENQHSVSDIAYTEVDQKYLLSGSAKNGNTISYGWMEKRDYDSTVPSASQDWENKFVSTNASLPTTLNFMKQTLTYGGDIIVGGKTADIPWIAKYNASGVQQWMSTSQSADVEYTSVACKNNCYYACGYSDAAGQDGAAFIEKWDDIGSPQWGKSSTRLGGDVKLNSIAANNRGEVVAVGEIDGEQTVGYVVKVDMSTGDILWDLTIDSGEYHSMSVGIKNPVALNSVYVDGNDQIYIVGQELSTEGGIHFDGVIFKYTAEGNLIWHKRSAAGEEHIYSEVWSDTEVEQTIVLSHETVAGSPIKKGPTLIKYSKNGDVVFKRRIQSSTNTSQIKYGLDGDPSFYYILFVDEDNNVSTGASRTYNFGKVSASGNGFGEFTYDATNSKTITYSISSSADRLGRLSDGSVRNDSSDLISYPYSGLKTLFDDYATNIAYKKTRHPEKDVFLYSGSPAIRVADFQELNLLGDVYSGSGDWLDQSGKGNDAVVEFTTTTTTGGTTESENFRTVTSSYSTYGTVAENTVTNDLPYNNADWSHYGGKVRDLQTGGFRIDLTGNSTGTDFFMACWIKFDTYAVSRQMGIDLFGGYVYWETLANGAIAVRHNGGNRADSSATSLNDGNWHHIALSRTGGTLYGMLDGASVISTTSGVSGNSVNSNENFWFFGGSGNAYITDAKILDPIVAIGTGVSGYTVPTEPVIDASGTFPNASPHVPFFSNNWAYISPAVSLGGSTTTTTNGPTYNAAGYWDFDGTDDKIFVNDLRVEELGETFTVEAWIYPTDFAAPSGSPGDAYPRRIMSTHRATGSTKWCLGIDTSGRLGFGGSQGTEEPVGNKYQLSLNTYYHVMLVHDGTEYTLYVDGIERANNTSSPIDAANDTQDPSLCIGGRPHAGTDRVYKGRIGDVRAHLKPLTAAQVFQNYNATKSKYINEASDTAPKIGPGILQNIFLLLNYDFGNRATYDRAENVVKYSEDFKVDELETWGDTGVNWLDKSKVTSNYAMSPFGEMTATRVANDTGSDRYLNYRANYSGNGSIDVSGQWTVSAYVKPLSNPCTIQLGQWDGFTERRGVFNLVSGTLSSSNETDANTIEEVGGGWYRISSTATNGNTNTAFQIKFYDGTDLLLYGAQMERGSTLGRYIRTYGSAITAPTTVKNLANSSFTGTFDAEAAGQSPEFNVDGYMEFGNKESIRFGSLSDLNIPTGSQSHSITLECWVQARAGVNQIFAGIQSPASQRLYLAAHDDDGNGLKWEFGWGDFSWTQGYTGGTSGTDAAAVVQNTWTHYCLSINSGVAKLYINGSFTIEKTDTAVDLETGDFPIGGFFEPSETYNTNNSTPNNIGQFRIYERALTATEVSQNFNATRARYGV